MSEETRNFVHAAESYVLYDEHTSCVGDITVLTDTEILQRYAAKRARIRDMKFHQIWAVFPVKLVLSVLGTAAFVAQYYAKLCTPDVHDGNRMVSKDMHLPKS